MTLNDQQISKIVDTVVNKIRAYQVYPGLEHIPLSPGGGIFQGVEEAITAAEFAQKKLLELSLEKRKEIISAMRVAARNNARYLAELAVKETGMGRIDDKEQKNLLCANKTPGPEDLVSTAWTGDHGLTLVEMAPFGVIGSITPSTNPSATAINNSISMISAGNSVVYNPHPSAKKVTNEAIRILNRAIIAAGGPENLLTSTVEPTLQSSNIIMSHPKIRCLVVTGGPAVVKAAMSSGKKTIAAGPGNPPVIVDDTADIRKAAKGIITGASFDNGILCTAEKEIFAFDNITDQLKNEMKRYGAIEIENRQIDQLVEVAFNDPFAEHPVVNKDFVGKNASVLLENIGIRVGDEIRTILIEVPDDNHPFVIAEQLMPVLPIVRVKDIDEALQKSIKVEHGFRHSAIMWSENIVNMSLVAKNIGTTIFTKNAPSLAGLGFGGEGFTTMTIAGSTGEGITSARTFTRQRRCVLADAFRII